MDRVVLISAYELGRQPFGLASPAAWLRDAGADVVLQDLAVTSFDADSIRDALLVGVYVPMHTATRMAEPVLTPHRVPGRAVVSLGRQQFPTPDRTGLPGLQRYAGLLVGQGRIRTVGYTEASRGCKHLCRHCPIVPLYGGRFRVVQAGPVLEDICQQVKAGAEHITFGDPDFFNAPAHSMKIVAQLHEEFPELSYDVTVKVEHLRKHANLVQGLKRTGCLPSRSSPSPGTAAQSRPTGS